MGYAIKPALNINGEQITAPVAPEVREALERWGEKRHYELVAVLAPFGLHPYDLAAIEWRQVVYPGAT